MISLSNSPGKSNHYPIATMENAYAEFFAAIPWSTFCTFTYQTSIYAIEKVQRDIRRLFYLADARAWGINQRSKRFRKDYNKEKYTPYFLTVENHKSGALHAHALCGLESQQRDAHNIIPVNKTIPLEILKNTWSTHIKDAGFTKFEPVRNNNKASKYLIKSSRYLLKHQDSTIDWYGLGDAFDRSATGAYHDVKGGLD